jgi:hypothetical protein
VPRRGEAVDPEGRRAFRPRQDLGDRVRAAPRLGNDEEDGERLAAALND